MRTSCGSNGTLNRSVDGVGRDMAEAVWNAVKICAAARGFAEPIPPQEQLRALRVIFRAVTGRMVDLKRQLEAQQ